MDTDDILNYKCDYVNLIISLGCYTLYFQLSKVVNEVYHQYNRHQYPFVVLKINAEKGKIILVLRYSVLICQC